MFGFIEPEFDQHDWWLIEPEDIDHYLLLVGFTTRGSGSDQQVVGTHETEQVLNTIFSVMSQ